MRIDELDAASVAQHAPRLAALLRACIDGGAGLGFLRTASDEALLLYWSSVQRELAAGHRRAWAAWDGDELLGAVQLVRAAWETGRHRGEVVKLMVAPARRGTGIARALMERLEREAATEGMTLLVLDTFQGSDGDRWYRRHGWTEAGRIPDYALTPDGKPEELVLFWKKLAPPR